MIPPAPPQKGDRGISADYFRRLDQFLKTITPGLSATLRLVQSPSGFCYETKNGGGSGSSGTTGHVSYLVTVAKDGGVVGPPSTWTYTCTEVGGSQSWAAVANRSLRSANFRYDFAPDGSYGILFVVAGTAYLFLQETEQEQLCGG